MTASAKTSREPAICSAVLDDDIPVLFEDEEEEMGTANPHAWADYLLFGPLVEVIARRRPDHQVFRDLNCYYEVKGRRSAVTGRMPNFASDIMIVRPTIKLPFETKSYTIGVDGPQPITTMEILSQETATVRDLKEKLEIYRKLKIREYVLVDLTGEYLAERLLLKRLQKNGKWKDVIDSDGGLTSELGFRLVIDAADPLGLFVVDTDTGRRWARPHEANAAVEGWSLAEEARRQAEEARRLAEARAKAAEEARRLAEERLHSLQAELDRLRH